MMGLYFKNNAPSTIWLAIATYSPGCEGGVDWSKKGWFQITPGATAKVKSGWAGNESYMYFAEDDQGHVWAGPFITQVPMSAFEWCWNTGSTGSSTVGFRDFHVSWEIMDYTMNLRV